MLEINSTTQTARVPVTIVNIKGEVDASNYEIFQSQAEKIISDGATHLLLNLQEVAYMSSAGLRVIHGLFNKLRELHKNRRISKLRTSLRV